MGFKDKKIDEEFTRFRILPNSKKAVSIMIGYIILVTITIALSAIVYQQLVTYVPTESIQCDEGVSIFLQDVNYNCTTKELSITVKNSGRFNVAGYFIAGSETPGILGTIDLSKYNEGNYSQIGVVLLDIYSVDKNPLTPGEKITTLFDLSQVNISSVDVLPARYQDVDGKYRLVSCSNSRIRQPLICATNQTGGSGGNQSQTYQCNDGIDNDGDTKIDYGTGTNNDPGCSSENDNTETDGVASSQCNDGLDNDGDTFIDYPNDNGCSSSTDDSEISTQCNDGLDNDGDTFIDYLSDGGCESFDDDSEAGGAGSGTQQSCPNYCVSLGYTSGSCTNSPGNCQSSGGTYQSGGNQWCTGGSQADTCCCTGFIEESGGGEGTNLGYFGFESGEQGWEDGGADSERSNARSTKQDNGANGGSFSWRLDDDFPDSSYTQQNFNLAGYSTVTIEFWGWKEDNFESGDCVELKIDGNIVQTFGESSCDVEMQDETWLFQSVSISSSQHNFDSSVTIRFEGNMGENEDFYVDGINITGVI